MEYRLLGPLEVLDANGRKLPLGGARQQSVLASLLLRAEQTVSLERLVDELWEEPPATALRTAQVYVSRLRHELRPGAIESRTGGYALLLNGDQLDLRAFEHAAEEGRQALGAGDHERAARLLREALALWRGPALVGLRSDALRREAARLEELRLQVLEDRFEADLRCDRHHEVLAEVKALVAEHPFRERSRAQLMLVLHRSGRRGEALGVYRETRRLFVDELGMEPGPELRALERSILTHDEAPETRIDVAQDERSPERPTAPSGTVTFLFSDIEGSTRLVKQLRGGYSEILAQHQRLLRAAFASHRGHEIETQGDSFFVAFGSAREAVLAAVEAQRALVSHDWPEASQVNVRMGIHTGQAVASDGRYTGVAVHRAARICAAGHGGQVLVSHATETLLQDEEEELPVFLRDLGEQRLKDLERPFRLYQAEADGLATAFPPLRLEAPLAQAAEAAIRPPAWRRRYVWAAGAVGLAAVIAAMVFVLTRGGASIVQPNAVGVIDPTTNTVTEAIPVGASPGSVAYGEGAAWVANLDDKTVSRIDPQTHRERAIPVNGTPSGIAAGLNAVWVTQAIGTLEHVDPRYNQPSHPIQVLDQLGPHLVAIDIASVAIGPRAVWVVYGDSTVARIDQPGDRVSATGYAGNGPAGIAVGEDAVWIANEKGNDVTKLDPRTAKPARAAPIAVGGGPSGIAVGGGAVWTADRFSDQVTRIDPLTDSTTSIRVGIGPDAIAYGYGSVWVANGKSGTVSRIDPKTNTPIATIEVGNSPAGIAVGGGRVWVTVQPK